MDIISHTLTGLAVGTVASSFSKESWNSRFSIVFFGGLAGALPDLDAISKWSRFDETIGEMFNLAHTGSQIYYGKFWYSHHGAFHSLVAPILLSLFVLTMVAAIRRFRSIDLLKQHLNSHSTKYLAFCLGFIFHLFEDMPTPASVWGGVNFFFPGSSYVGGFGKIWWWNVV